MLKHINSILDFSQIDECYVFHTSEDFCIHSNCSKPFDGCPHLMALELMCAVLYTHKTNGELISVRKQNYKCMLDDGIY